MATRSPPRMPWEDGDGDVSYRGRAATGGRELRDIASRRRRRTSASADSARKRALRWRPLTETLQPGGRPDDSRRARAAPVRPCGPRAPSALPTGLLYPGHERRLPTSELHWSSSGAVIRSRALHGPLPVMARSYAVRDASSTDRVPFSRFTRARVRTDVTLGHDPFIPTVRMPLRKATCDEFGRARKRRRLSRGSRPGVSSRSAPRSRVVGNGRCQRTAGPAARPSPL